MLFLIAQGHTPETCPRDVGGPKTLCNAEAEGVTLRARYAAFSEHVIYYVVEATSQDAIQEFLAPGFTSCTATVTPVSEESTLC
jgi:hypothetical protein